MKNNYEACYMNINVPDGWKLVPIDVTADMCNAVEVEVDFGKSAFEQTQIFWDKLLEASPSYNPDSL